MTGRREHLAQARVIAAQLALAEAELYDATLDTLAQLLAEARSARKALHQIVVARGRQT